jgi:hypothetical protein
MRPNPLRLLVLALPLLALAGCGTTRSCGSDTDYLQAVERPPIKLPADFTPSERIQPLAIPPVDPNPVKLDPEPRCLDEPPKYFARKAQPPAPAAPAALTAPAATAASVAPAATATTAASVAPAAAATTVAPSDGADEVVRAWAAAWAAGQPDAVVQMYSENFQAAGEGGSAAFLEQRRQQVVTGRSPAATLEEVTVAADGPDRRVVRFLQRFGEGAVRKEMTLAREGGTWRIVAERTLEVL